MPAGVQITLSAEDFLAAARARTGIGILDKSALEPLSRWLRALNTESALHAAGATAMADRILHLLCNRLRMQRDFARHPEIADEKIEAPIFFCGMARTGSTKTHRLFSASGDFNWVSYWQVFNPSLLTGDRTESSVTRIEEAEDYARWFDAASPDLRYGHPFEPHEPEEESLILEHSLKTPVMLGWTPIDSYLAWLLTQDMTTQFVHLRDTLKYLQWQGLASPAKRWVLKSPLYTGLEAPLLQIFPDASLVMTHRHPATTIPSGLRVMDLFYQPFTTARGDAKAYIAGQAAAANTHLDNRASIPGFKILDLSFRELTGAVGPAMERVYDFVGADLSEPARRRMLDWNEANPQHKKGGFAYALEDFGLTGGDIDGPFARYIDFLDRNFGE